MEVLLKYEITQNHNYFKGSPLKWEIIVIYLFLGKYELSFIQSITVFRPLVIV